MILNAIPCYTGLVCRQPDSKAIPKCQPNSEREKKNRSGLIPRALGPTKTSLNCLK